MKGRVANACGGCLALAVGVACALGARPAVAASDTSRPGAYVGLGGVYAFHWFAGHAYDRDLGGTAGRVTTSGSPGLNVRAGYRARPWLAAEIEYEWLEGFRNDVAGSNVATLASHMLTLNGKLVYPGWGWIQPYALGGMGFSIWEARDRSGSGAGLDATSAGFAGRIGLGVDAWLSEHWLLDLGLAIALSTTEIENSLGGDLDNLFYVPIQLGVRYRF
jgi:opacity protein-like surface antigen